MNIENLLKIEKISSKAINLKRSEYYIKTVKKNKREELEKEGWELMPSKLKKTIRMRKLKPHNKAFENRVWALFAKMRFEYINIDSTFKIAYQEGLTKQVDVFTAEREAILVVECKSTKTRRRISYQKDINELIGIKNRLRLAAQKLIKGKPKVAFIFATNNSILSENDRTRLRKDLIFHFNQDDVEYFEQLTDHLGEAAKYQLFGKLFSGQKIPELKNKVPAIRGKVSSGYPFYSFSIDPEYLLKIGFILHRTETNPEATRAYQRLVKKPRLKQIGKYIEKGGYFPNSIIVNIQTKSNKALKFEQASQIFHDSSTSFGVLHLPQRYKSAFIIDGQHRLYGYSIAKTKSSHTIPVVAFHNMPPEEQARIFIDVNHTQRSVPANLLHSIMADFNWGSDNDRLALSALKTRLFIEMNADDSSPFYKRIILAEERQTDERCLTLQTIKSWGFNKVDFFGKLKGDNLIKTGSLTDVDYEKTLIKSLSFFNKCFTKIEEDLNEQWNRGRAEGGFIAMNIGVTATFRVLDNIIEHLVKNENFKPEDLNGEELADEVLPYLESVVDFVKNLNNEGLKKLRSLFGSGATEKVLREFQNAIHEEYPEFAPEGLEQWITDNSGVFNQPAYELGHNHIEPLIDEFVKSKLKKEYGEKKWWIEGVSRNIQKQCSDHRIDAGTGEPDWNFLNTIHYYTIIEKNWDIFGNYFTMPGMDNVKRSKKLDWLQQLNSIRQKYSHPQRENTTEEEYNFLKEIHEWLIKSLIE
jgi:DNA sulfur modification protein DndB